MAIVLEVSLSLNPNNQIAYLGDFTGLIVDTEYLINSTYLTYDTRFTFRGNLDITLTKPPIGVPQAGTVVPAEITTVPEAAPAPLPVTYPYSAKDRINAAALNLDFEFSPASVPPHSTLGGAGKFKYWVDTSPSQTLPTLRQCIVPRASTTYNAAEWITLGTIDVVAGKFHFNGSDVDFTGGEGGASTIFNVTNLTVQGATNLTTLNVSGASTLSTLNVSGATTLSSLTVPTINGATSITGTLTVPRISYGDGHTFAFGWDGSATHVYVDGSDVGIIGDIQSVSAGNGLTGGGTSGALTLSMSGSYSGNFGATGTVSGNYLYSGGDMACVGNLSASGNLQVNNNINATGSVDCGYLHSRGGGAVVGDWTVGGNQTVNNNLNVNTLHSNTYVDAAYFQGGTGAAGTLRMYNTGNNINFRWDGGAGAAAYRIDNSVEKYMCTTANVFDLQYAYPGGGPTNAVMGGHDVPGTWYYSYIDYTSDERIKDDIRPSEVDALGILKAVPVSQFNVKGAVAAWFRNIGLATQERIASMRNAVPVHVPIGFVAQHIQPHLPNAVLVARQDGAIPEAPLPIDVLNVNKQEFIPYLVRAVQQLAERVEQLESA